MRSFTKSDYTKLNTHHTFYTNTISHMLQDRQNENILTTTTTTTTQNRYNDRQQHRIDRMRIYRISRKDRSSAVPDCVTSGGCPTQTQHCLLLKRTNSFRVGTVF